MVVSKLKKIKRIFFIRNLLKWKLYQFTKRITSFIDQYLLPTSKKLFGSSKPELGRTQYLFGAVVLILNKIGLSVGFFNSICDVMAWLNGPKIKIYGYFH